MKNKYSWSQVADIYSRELGIEYPQMENYLKGIYSDLPIDDYEKEITELIKTTKHNKSEYFPDLY